MEQSLFVQWLDEGKQLPSIKILGLYSNFDA